MAIYPHIGDDTHKRMNERICAVMCARPFIRLPYSAHRYTCSTTNKNVCFLRAIVGCSYIGTDQMGEKRPTHSTTHNLKFLTRRPPPHWDINWKVPFPLQSPASHSRLGCVWCPGYEWQSEWDSGKIEGGPSWPSFLCSYPLWIRIRLSSLDSGIGNSIVVRL